MIEQAIADLDGMAAHDAYVAWSTTAQGFTGELTRLRFGDSAPEVLASDLDIVPGLAGNATHIGWSPLFAAPIKTIAIDGGSPVDVGLTDITDGLAMDDTTIYWLSGSAIVGMGEALSAPVAGGSTTTIFSLSGQQVFGEGGIAVAPEYVYAVVDSNLVRAPRGGGSPTIMTPVTQFTRALGADASGVYVATLDQILHYANPGASPIVIAALDTYQGLPQPNRLVVTRGYVYWAEWQQLPDTSARLNRAATSGSGTEQLATGSAQWHSVAVTSSAVLWLSTSPTTGATDILCMSL